MVLFLKPVFQERIWGGNALTQFGYDIPSDQTGESWAISAHQNGPNVIENGKHQGKTLDKVWEEDRALFDNDSRTHFPLLTKILDAHDQLSVQVHPNDDYALKHEGEYGKTECWYILDAEPGSEIIYGVEAQTKEELEQLIDNKDFDHLFTHVPVHPGDFYYVPAGTVHAIGSGILILETQQSSDTTYRIYDYDRKDKNGNTRELHLEQSKDVIDISNRQPNTSPHTKEIDGNTYTQFVSNTFFTVEKWDISEHLTLEKPHPYCLVSVIEGDGQLTVDDETFTVQKGTHFILTTEDKAIQFNGHMELIISHP
ncbi:mannose-6-phosphate isomerase, class I [Staphylococcus capitis]|uniref:mannose-6-phosphate isomerase, class I n=1 Tax=Staphylococcus TaxID=1279 RepID=UPI00019294F4|nr:mannose-6-phosphate isomerase, class I [Staphylococcus capitis]EEE48442.1 mannose-6-phosphate isomerase, class I [Staphylococcus capitis SK14]EGS40407.1 mannose-6-phosphate isomerase, class I [Staphylococcus capitis VCU116]MCT2014214.1 mannose-6-phosphate isomerase, class I [Staphylococcus capitis]MEB5629297.1 mannose-6-phosphate isomerase, class I [Staphylococcus capitis]OAO25729.1 mannose-6-phosphate isomerase [Staphylococcus capitis]